MRRAGRESLNLNHYRHTSRDYGLPLLDKNLNNRNRQMFYHLLNAQLSRYRSCMFTTRLRSSTLSSGYDRKFRDRSRQFGMCGDRNRKLRLLQLLLPVTIQRKKLPFRRIILRKQRKKLLNRKPELPHPEAKIRKAGSSMQQGVGYIRKLRSIKYSMSIS